MALLFRSHERQGGKRELRVGLTVQYKQVTRSEGAKDIERGRQAMLSLRPVLKEKSLLAPVNLELEGLSHFRHQVLSYPLAGGFSPPHAEPAHHKDCAAKIRAAYS